jgi:hypothetical protein
VPLGSCGVWWGLAAVLWAGAEECGDICRKCIGCSQSTPTLRIPMTDRNDSVPAQEKLEWVTPKISLMEAGDTDGKISNKNEITLIKGPGPS